MVGNKIDLQYREISKEEADLVAGIEEVVVGDSCVFLSGEDRDHLSGVEALDQLLRRGHAFEERPELVVHGPGDIDLVQEDDDEREARRQYNLKMEAWSEKVGSNCLRNAMCEAVVV